MPFAYNIFRNLAYKPDQLQPVSNMIRTTNIVSAHPSVPVKSIPELIEHLKKNPDSLSYATSGTGQSPHLTAAWFLQLTGLKMAHVPFRGAGPALTAALGGQVQILFDNPVSLAAADPRRQARRSRDHDAGTQSALARRPDHARERA
jgi:tripartite-type tricarboxylate transporter receptor subunit TctC